MKGGLRMLESDAAVVIGNLSYSYGGPPVLENVNLRLERGKYVCVIGPNGGGKSTLLKLILGLLAPDKGTIQVLGRAPVLARPSIGYVPQHPRFDPQFPIRAVDVVCLGRLGKRSSLRLSREDRRMAERMLDWVGLLEERNSQFSQLSGGQRQRVLIARALATEPELLLMDEPTAGLDLHVEGKLQSLLADLRRTLTIVTVSHDLGFASDLVDSTVCVNRTVIEHPTMDLTPAMLDELYGGHVKVIDHAHSEAGHE